MRKLLGKLNTETFILDLTDEIETSPELNNYQIKLVNPHTLEVELKKEQRVNELVHLLTEKSIGIHSMRNKSNRLEELFIRLLDNNNNV